MVTLYHGGTSVASAKVRLALAEKCIPFESRLFDLGRGDHHNVDYLSINPAGVVPTLVDAERIISESSIILEYIEETWPTPPLLSGDPYQRAQTRLWLRRVDDLHEACSTLSSAVKLVAFREHSARQTEAFLAAVRKPSKRARQRRLIDQGFDAPDIDEALNNYRDLIAEMARVLGQGSYIRGHSVSLADLAVLPYVNRAELLGLGCIWAEIRQVVAWLQRMRSRPSYAAAITAWVPEGVNSYVAHPELVTRAAQRT
jgi:glutathione S-transferase